jgi:hypothetical protein
MLEENFNTMSEIALMSQNNQPLAVAISNLDDLHFSMLTASLIFEMATGKPKIEHDSFEIKSFIIYLHEVIF